MDVNPKHNFIVVCGVSKTQGKGPAILCYKYTKDSWKPVGSLQNPQSTLVSCTKVSNPHKINESTKIV